MNNPDEDRENLQKGINDEARKRKYEEMVEGVGLYLKLCKMRGTIIMGLCFGRSLEDESCGDQRAACR